VPVPKSAITVHHVEGAGCYGHNGADDVALDAVLMALRHPGRPVRVLWSREDELTHSPVGAAQLVALEARVDDSGHLTHWRHALWANGYSSRPGRARTPTLLAASERADATALPLPINPPLAAGGGAERNAVPAYTVPNLEVLTHRLTVMPLRTSAMRALGAYANVFAIECFMDEIARALGEDALTFRRRHLDDARALAVLEAVTERSDWWGQRTAAAEGSGQGLAWARYKNTGAWCAVIARVHVTDVVRVLDLDLAVDVGTVVDLDGVVNQIEGGAVQSTSWTLKEQVTFTREGLTSTGWESYPVLRFAEVPNVRVHVLDRPDQPSLGAGEAAQAPVAAAIANAVADALGVRVRTLPLTPENLLRAVHAAESA
jgi:CO/xanthine dehydrogenase Mo-binding subunit